MDTRLIWESALEIIFRAPIEASGFTWVSTPKETSAVTANNSFTTSITIPHQGRHFWIKNGELVFCDDDAVTPGQHLALVPISEKQAAGRLVLLPPALQASPLISIH